MLKDVVVEQDEIVVDERHFTVTRIPTATSGSWFVVHDAFEIWAAVAIDLNGEVVGWRNPPEERYRAGIEKAIKEAFELPAPEPA